MNGIDGSKIISVKIAIFHSDSIQQTQELSEILDRPVNKTLLFIIYGGGNPHNRFAQSIYFEQQAVLCIHVARNVRTIFLQESKEISENLMRYDISVECQLLTNEIFLQFFGNSGIWGFRSLRIRGSGSFKHLERLIFREFREFRDFEIWKFGNLRIQLQHEWHRFNVLPPIVYSQAMNTKCRIMAFSIVKDGNPVTGTGYAESQNNGPAVQNGTSSSNSSEKSNDTSPAAKVPARTRVPPGGYSSGLW
ncbi:hypothetical protein E2986_12096 [Frieseomelitta varia]|uniref:Uncharacterized protein n=1 Tax=Frieseomelitta varia TaxID=561572 RepID=A0A833VSB3_9HYME|nr:hypothetical protein E2986_12096 [Frieseomelitta varia]